MTTSRLLTSVNNNDIVHGVSGVHGSSTTQNNNNNNNKNGFNIIKGKSLPQKRIQRPCMSKPTICMVPSNSIPSVNTNRNIIRQSPPTPNNTPYPSKTFNDGNCFNKLQKPNDLCCNKDPEIQLNGTWNEMLSINSSKSESVSTAHESRKYKHHHYLKHKSHSQRYTKNNENIGITGPGQKPSTDHKLNLLIFNPHRTLQFLVSELKSNLRSPKSDENNIHRILSEIQQTIKRLESPNTQTSDMTSNTNSAQENQENRVNKTNNSFCQTDDNNISISKIANSKQTDNNNNNNQQNSQLKLKMEIFEKEIKRNYEKFTENYKLLEKTCKLLNEDKSKITTELSKSQTEMSTLRNQISHLQDSFKDTAMQEKTTIEHLQEQFNSLQYQLKTLQDSVTLKEANELLTIENLTTKVKESSARISTLEKSGIDSKKMFVLTKLENEKLVIMEKFRSHQINSMQNNINDIHKFIRHELKELQRYLSNTKSKDISEAVSQNSSNKMEKLFENTIQKQNLKLKFPFKKSYSTLKINSKSYPSMNSNIKSSSKSIKHNSKIENLIINNTRSGSARSRYISNVNETNVKSLSAGRSMMGTRSIDVKNQNHPSETSETSSFIEEMKKNYNKIVGKKQENEFINIDDDDKGNGIGNGKNLKNFNLQEHQQQQQHYQRQEKNSKNYQTKSESKATNSSKNITNFQSMNKNERGIFSTDAYNLFAKESNFNSKGKVDTLSNLYQTSAGDGDGGRGMRSPLKPSAAIPIKKNILENRKSLKKYHPTTNREIPLPNTPLSNRKHLHGNADDDDEHNKLHHHSYRQTDSNEFNNKKSQYHNQQQNSNEIYITGDRGGYPNDQNHSMASDYYHIADSDGNNYNSNYCDKLTTNDDKHHKNANFNDNRNPSSSKDKYSTKHKDRRTSTSNKQKKPQLVQWNKYHRSRLNGENNHEERHKQQSDEVGGCGDYFTHVRKPEIPILKYTSNFDEFRTILDDVITSSDRDGCSISNRNNNNKIDISSDLNNSTSFDLSPTEYTDV